MRYDLSACCAHEDETDTNESVQALARKKWKPIIHCRVQESNIGLWVYNPACELTSNELCEDVAQLLQRCQHAADAGSIPRCGKGFFFQSQLSVQTLLRYLCTLHVHSHALTPVRKLKIP